MPKEEWETYRNALLFYSEEMFHLYERQTTIRGELMWCDFTTLFCKEGILNLPRAALTEWRTLLLNKGVHVRSGKGIKRTDALIECLDQEKFIPTTDSLVVKPVDEDESTARPTTDPKHTPDDSQPKPTVEIVQKQTTFPERSSTQNLAKNSQDSERTSKVDFIVPDSKNHSNSLGLSGLSKMYSSRPRFSGELDQDLHGMISDYRALCATCRLSDYDMARGITFMLERDALTFYSTHLTSETDFEKVVEALRRQFTSDAQRARLLHIWQNTRLSQHMRNNKENSELEVFKDVVHILTKTQRQLDTVYQNDINLRDQIVVSVDLLEIARPLREKTPVSSHEAVQRIANLMNADPGSAGKHRQDEDNAFYGFGMRYGGDAKRNFRKTNRPHRTTHRKHNANRKRGCIVCGKDHFARNHHSQDDIVAAIRRTKRSIPRALYVEESLMLTALDDECNSEDEGELSDSDGSESNLSVLHAAVEPFNTRLGVTLSNHAFCHGTFDRLLQKAYDDMNAALRKGEGDEFKGIIMDTGANRSSMMSLQQYLIYCQEFGAVANINKAMASRVRGIGGKCQSIGVAVIPIPFHDLGITCDVFFHSIEGDVPSLFCLSDMKREGLDLRILEDRVDHLGRSYHNALLWHKWTPADCNFALYTEPELRKLHRSFGHPASSALSNLLKKARPDEFDANVREALEDITRACDHGQRYSTKPRRFKLAVGTEELRCNHTVAVDIMTIDKRPVLHVVDEGTHFMTARWLPNMTSGETWKAIRRCWIDVYLGPPDFLRVDQGTNLVSKEFKGSTAACDITILEAPVKSPSTMSHVERYHPPLRAAYKKLRFSLNPKETDADVLQLAVKAVNDTIGPEGLCPTLLVFGALPRPARNLPAATQLERSHALEQAMKAVEKEHAHRKVQFGLKYKGPYGRKRNDLFTLPHGAPVLVYREKTRIWEGPFKFFSIDGDTVVVQLPHGRQIFRSHVVKPYLRSDDNRDDPPGAHLLLDEEEQTKLETLSFNATLQTNRQMPPNSQHNFQESRRKELDGLTNNGVFQIVPRDSVHTGTRVQRSKWVDVLKADSDGKLYEKSRPVVQGCRDYGAANIPTRSPTVARLAQRLVLASAAMHPQHALYLRDISQAYTQSKTMLERAVYLEPPTEMNMQPDELLLVLKTLYGLPESGLHWFATYHQHHITQLEMQESKADRCLLYKRDDGGTLDGTTMLQVDDSCGHGSQEFLADEDKKSTSFKCKPRVILQKDDSKPFNGTVIGNKEHGYTMTQHNKLSALQPPTTSKELISVRAALQYIAGCTRPDLCSPTQLLSKAVSDPTPDVYKALNSIVDRAKETADLGLNFVPLDTNNLSMVMFTDANFANAEKCTTQLGFVICLVDGDNRANIIHYGSQRCRRVTRSVMAAELLALSYGFDQAFVAKHMTEELIGREIQLHALIDSRTLFNTITKSRATLEKRLQIDAYALRQSHHRGELYSLAWIPSEQNIADAFTKGLPSKEHIIYNLLRNNRLRVTPTGWVHHCGSHSIAKEKKSECRLSRDRGNTR